jgi:hypothetical protein
VVFNKIQWHLVNSLNGCQLYACLLCRRCLTHVQAGSQITLLLFLVVLQMSGLMSLIRYYLYYCQTLPPIPPGLCLLLVQRSNPQSPPALTLWLVFWCLVVTKGSWKKTVWVPSSILHYSSTVHMASSKSSWALHRVGRSSKVQLNSCWAHWKLIFFC